MVTREQAGLIAAAKRGTMSRRQVLEAGLRLGMASPVLLGLIGSAPAVSAAPRTSSRPIPTLRQEGASGAFTALIGSSADDADPHSTYSTIGSMLCIPAYEMLIRYKGESLSEYEPVLAESWQVNEDHTEVTFTLRENVRFHDGTPCDAAAVKASMTRLVKMELGPYIVLERFAPDPDTQITAVDARTLTFTFPTPQPLFLPAMASSYGPMVVSPAAVEENKTDDDPWAHDFFMFNAVGTGPYRLVQNDLFEGARYERFEEYWGGWDGNHFDEVIYRVVPETATRRQLIETGEVDATAYNLTPDDVAALRDTPSVVVKTYPTTRINWVIMNAPRMLTKEVRQGFCYAFPYDEVMNGAYTGLLKRSGPLPDSMLGYDPDVFIYPTDLAKAKELIVAGGFPEGATFDYWVDSSDEVENTVAQLFQANVQAIGFNLEITALDAATIESMVFGDAPAEERPFFVGGWEWWPDYNDPWNMLAPVYLKDAIGSGGSNGGYWVNDRFEELMAEAETVADEARLVEIMKECQQILTELDPAVIYQGQTEMYTVLNPAIQGFVANPLYLETYFPYDLSRA